MTILIQAINMLTLVYRQPQYAIYPYIELIDETSKRYRIELVDVYISDIDSTCPNYLCRFGMSFMSTRIPLILDVRKLDRIRVGFIAPGTSYDAFVEFTFPPDKSKEYYLGIDHPSTSVVYAELYGRKNMPFTFTYGDTSVRLYYGLSSCAVGSNIIDGYYNPLRAMAKYLALYGTIPYESFPPTEPRRMIFAASSDPSTTTCVEIAKVPDYRFIGTRIIGICLTRDVVSELKNRILGSSSGDIYIKGMTKGYWIGDSFAPDWSMLFDPYLKLTSSDINQILNQNKSLCITIEIELPSFSVVNVYG